jgi:hypothetical protein
MTWTKKDDQDEAEKFRMSLRTPAFCPVCDIVMRSGSGGDDKTYFKFGCCRHCFIEFVEHREERWMEGWRPDADQVARMIANLSG